MCLCYGVACGMEHLHGARVGPNGRPVIHGDLKAANVLLAPGGVMDACRFVPKIAARSSSAAQVTARLSQV